ncbi:hypothetical protein CB0940_05518 [Cercospora beticola]|uniref:BTB domain-containing protein n=1 Tax=Cercospora beticola TaxID=122368 RepID=A0A2G5HXT8_CERBT|nr:hypothetical protein CB0940_05518 [Cercospora beticola]PIA97311.1 hypothetical protein CB0940_05518 [Cercospora beticola]CAK1359286.1 unnamed protein product [Cercospora beticola]
MVSSSDFAEVVALQSGDGMTRMLVHKDIITKKSLRLQRELVSQDLYRLADWPATTYLADSLDALKLYVTWCYTGSVSEDVTRRDSSGDWLIAFAEYKCGLWLLDAQYANAIMDKLMEQDFDARTLIDHCCEMVQHGLERLKIWQWYIHRLAAKISSDDLIRSGKEQKYCEPEGLPRVLLEDVLFEMTKCREQSEVSTAGPISADREKYHMSEETVEGFWEAWVTNEEVF